MPAIVITSYSIHYTKLYEFATVATGGFSTKNTSITDYSPYIQYVITVFMALSGINFTLHVLALRGRYKQAFKNQELHLYLKVILAVGFSYNFV